MAVSDRLSGGSRQGLAAMPFVETDLPIHYRVVGEGPPVLWHTGGCGDGRMWDLAGYLDGLPGYTHLVMDHRGRGRSGSPGDLSGHRMSAYVADASAVLDHAGVDHAVFVGYSFGASVGFAAALSAPDRWDGLVALDSVPDPEATEADLRAEARTVLTRGTPAVIDEFVAAEREPVPDWLVEQLRGTDTLAFAGAFEAEITAPDLWAAATSLEVPVLLVIGDTGHEDGTLPARLLVLELPHAELVSLPVEHLAAFHRTDLTLPVLGGFLAAVGGGRGQVSPPMSNS